MSPCDKLRTTPPTPCKTLDGGTTCGYFSPLFIVGSGVCYQPDLVLLALRSSQSEAVTPYHGEVAQLVEQRTEKVARDFAYFFLSYLQVGTYEVIRRRIPPAILP